MRERKKEIFCQVGKVGVKALEIGNKEIFFG